MIRLTDIERTVNDWLLLLEDDIQQRIRANYINQYGKEGLYTQSTYSLSEAINSFNWSNSNENDAFWQDIHQNVSKHLRPNLVEYI